MSDSTKESGTSERAKYIAALVAERDALREALEKIDQPGRPEPERGIARAALERTP